MHRNYEHVFDQHVAGRYIHTDRGYAHMGKIGHCRTEDGAVCVNFSFIGSVTVRNKLRVHVNVVCGERFERGGAHVVGTASGRLFEPILRPGGQHVDND